MHLLVCSCILQRCCEPCRRAQRNESAGNSGTSNVRVLQRLLQLFSCCGCLNTTMFCVLIKLDLASTCEQASKRLLTNLLQLRIATLCLLIAMYLQAASSQPEVQLRVLQVCNENLLQYVAFQCCAIFTKQFYYYYTKRYCAISSLHVSAPLYIHTFDISADISICAVQCALCMQTLVMVVTWRSCEMSEETISQALTVCLSLHEAKNATVRHAAYMTIRQIIRYAVCNIHSILYTIYIAVCIHSHTVYSSGCSVSSIYDRAVGTVFCYVLFHYSMSLLYLLAHCCYSCLLTLADKYSAVAELTSDTTLLLHANLLAACSLTRSARKQLLLLILVVVLMMTVLHSSIAAVPAVAAVLH
jgi:hypothetical protein